MLNVNITIPTYNRAYCLPQAIEAALGQSYHHLTVTVVDDASTDDTARAVRPYLSEPNFCYIKLGQNVGTANAKNVGLMLSDFDAITFHDSDDIPMPHKVMLQSRALMQPDCAADPILDWGAFGYAPGESLSIDVAVGAHRFVRLDGRVFTISKRISLIDDFFPNLQSPSQTEGDWILINSGLFRRRIFTALGGYLDSVEEDRELRNRTIGCGYLYHYIEEPLLTKIEMPVSLTVDSETGYRAQRRIDDRHEVWRRKRLLLQEMDREARRSALCTPVEIEGLEIEDISNASLLNVNSDIPCSNETLTRLRYALGQPLFEMSSAALNGVPGD